MLDTLLAWASVHEVSPTVIAQQLALVRFDRFVDPSTARRAVAASILASQECMTVLAQKLASQVDPQVPPSPARGVSPGEDYSTPSLEWDLEQKYRVVAEARIGAEYAQSIDHPRSRVLGPLSLCVVAKRSAFQQVFKKLFQPNKLDLVFVHLPAETERLPAPPPGITLYQCTSTSAPQPPATVKHRPSARELHHFLPQAVQALAQLAWVDEVLHIDEALIARSSFHEFHGAEHSVIQTKLRILTVMQDTGLLDHTCLLCTHRLPPEVVHTLHRYIFDATSLMAKIVMPHRIM